jgi:lipoprotein
MTRARFVFLVLGLVAIVVSAGCQAGESKKPESGGATSVSAPFAVTIEDGQATIWPGGSPIKTNIPATGDEWGGTVVSLRGNRVALLKSSEAKKITVIDESGRGPSIDISSGCDSIAAREDGVVLLCSAEVAGGYETKLKIFNRDLEPEYEVRLLEPAIRVTPGFNYDEPPTLIAAGADAVWVSYPSEEARSRGGKRLLVKFSMDGKPSGFTPIEGWILHPAISPNGRLIAFEGHAPCAVPCVVSSLHVIDLESMQQLWSSTYAPPAARQNMSDSLDFEIAFMRWKSDDNLLVLGHTYFRGNGTEGSGDAKDQHWRRSIAPRAQTLSDELLESQEREEVSWLGPGCNDVIRMQSDQTLVISRNGVETRISPARLAVAVERPRECR